MEVLTYVPSNVALIVSGSQLSGWNSITISRSDPVFKQIKGIRGKNTRTRIKNSSATIVIETPQTELINEVLSMVLEADSVNGTARLEISLMESTGSSFFTTSTAYIDRHPELKYTNELGVNVWTLVCEESQMFVGSARNAAVGFIDNGLARLKQFVSGS